MLEYRRQDLTNPTTLAGVKFWFQIDNAALSTILCYDKHPSLWDVDAIVKAIEDMEHMFYTQELGGGFLDVRKYTGAD
jgi:hypothetical protein